MSKILKLFGLASLVAAIAFSMAACDSGSGSDPNPSAGGSNTSDQEGYKTYTAYDEAGNVAVGKVPNAPKSEGLAKK